MANAEDELEWEEWDPSQVSFAQHMIAGSCAGLAEHVSMFPIDTVKTHVQCERCGSVSPMQTWNCAARIVGNEGIFRLWRGVSAMFAGCIPAHAAYFSVFESLKVILGADKEGHHPAAAAVCGGAAALSHDMFMTPFDMVKQRMQLGFHPTILHCVRSVVRAEGFTALYIAMPTNLIMNIPYGAVMVPVNESAKKILNPSGEYKTSVTMLAGSIAGAVAAAVTNPLDVIKTRLQTQDLEPCPAMVTQHKGTSSGSSSGIGGISNSGILNSSTVSSSTISSGSVSSSGATGSRPLGTIQRLLSLPFQGTLSVFRTILAEQGYRGFARGVVPRVMVQSPAVAISWTAYEGVKSLLVNKDKWF